MRRYVALPWCSVRWLYGARRLSPLYQRIPVSTATESSRRRDRRADSKKNPQRFGSRPGVQRQVSRESRRLLYAKEECNKLRREVAINCYSSKDTFALRLLYGRHTKCSA